MWSIPTQGTGPCTRAAATMSEARSRTTVLRKRTLMKIAIEQLSEAELIDLNNCIIARLRFLEQMRAHVEMLEFEIGDRITFRPPGQGPVEGMLTRYNKKTVTVITDDGRQWNVSPAVLSKAVPSKSKNSGGSNVVLLGKC